MKKTTIVCLADDQAQSLHSLRKLASVHVLPQVQPESSELDARKAELSDLNQALFFLQTLEKRPPQSGKTPMDDGVACRRKCVARLEEYRRLAGELAEVEQAIRLLEPWGHFDHRLIARLEERGWHYALLVRNNQKGAMEWFQNLKNRPEGAVELLVKATKDKLYTLVLSPEPLEALALPTASFPAGDDLKRLEERRREILDEQEKALGALQDHAAGDMPLLKAEQQRLEAEIRFLTARDGMGRSGDRLCYLQGYVPVSRLDELRETARRNGWAIRYEDVLPEDTEVPTKLVMPRHFGMAKVVLDFIGILPGYNEVDISVAVMLFLSLFCGMLVGDAGYGAIFCLLTGWGLWKARRTGNAALGQSMQLLLGMSGCTLMCGALSGNWFGLSWGGIAWLTDGERGQLNLQLFCFFLAAIHLSLGHLWKLSLVDSWRARLANLGWAIFLWANFFTVKCLLIDSSFAHFTIPAYMYAVGGMLILLFGINWRNVGDIIYSPFTFINSIGDILSYIRLYAVGLSSVYIAKAFNDMSAMLWSQNRLLLPLGVLIILAGHALNVCMALMSVLVHGIRLNTLEFSGHIGVEWGGRPYRPFK